MAMIDTQALIPLMALADSANPTLGFQHRLVVIFRNAVSLFEPLFFGWSAAD
jgi:hypothetical protein